MTNVPEESHVEGEGKTEPDFRIMVPTKSKNKKGKSGWQLLGSAWNRPDGGFILYMGGRKMYAFPVVKETHET